MSEFTDNDRERLVQCHTLLIEMKEDHGKQLGDHESRIRENEKSRYTMMGVSGVLGAIAGFFTKFIGGG